MDWALTVNDGNNMKVYVHCAHHFYIFACSAVGTDNPQCKSKQRSFSVQLESGRLLWLAPAVQPSPCQAAGKQQGRSNSRRGNKKCYCRTWCARNSRAHASRRANNKPGCVFKCSNRFLVPPPSCRLWLISSDPPCFTLCARLEGRPRWLWGGDADRHCLWHFITVFASPRCTCVLTSYTTLARSSRGIDHYLAACDRGNALQSLKRGRRSSHVPHHTQCWEDYFENVIAYTYKLPYWKCNGVTISISLS